jgi:subtilisin family serine protease
MLNFPYKTKRKLSIIIASAIVLFTFATAIFYFFSNSYANNISLDYDEEIKEVLKDDDYGGIKISKNSLNNLTYAQLISEYNLPQTNSCDDVSTVSFSINDAKSELQNLGYTVFEYENEYTIFSKFYLKRLIVLGEYSQTYDAVKVVKGEDYDILCYDSEEAASLAYESLSNENGVMVTEDKIVSLDETLEEVSYDNYTSWGAEAMEVEPYRQYLQSAATDEDIAVVVIDTGINTSHEAFTDRFIYENGMIVGYSYVDTKYTYSGYSFEDDDGHGTHVSGIIADLTPSNVKIIPIRVLGGQFSSLTSVFSGLDKAVAYAQNYNVVCANLSLSSDYDLFSKIMFNSYFSKLKSKKVLSVVAAGNEATSTSNRLPAACETPLVVSALKKTTQSGKTVYTFDNSYSNYGSHVDFSAAGTEVLSAYKSSSNVENSTASAILSGTSMATPHVTAAVALLCADSYYWDGSTKNYTVDTIEHTLRQYAVKLDGNDRDNYYGYGMISFANFEKKEAIDVTCTLQKQSGTYGDEINLDNTAFTVTVAGGVDTSGLQLTLSTAATSSSAIGDYTLTATVSQNPDNLNVTIVNSIYTITRRQVTVEVFNQTGYYGDNPVLDQTQYTAQKGSFVNGDESKMHLSTSTDGMTLGTYAIHFDSADTDYTIIYKTGYYTVQPRPVEIELQNQASVYGDDITLNNSLYSVTSGNVINGDDLNVSLNTTATNGANAGNYAIRFASANSNYKVTATNGVYTIMPRQLVIQLADQTVDYSNDITLSQTAYEVLVGGYDGIVLDGITITTEDTNYEAGKTYTIIGENTNSNYDVTFVTAQLTVSEAEQPAPVDPEEPDKPDTPDIPDPDNPDTPDIPDPDNPDTPEPDTPEEPSGGNNSSGTEETGDNGNTDETGGNNQGSTDNTNNANDNTQGGNGNTDEVNDNTGNTNGTDEIGDNTQGGNGSIDEVNDNTQDNSSEATNNTTQENSNVESGKAEDSLKYWIIIFSAVTVLLIVLVVIYNLKSRHRHI